MRKEFSEPKLQRHCGGVNCKELGSVARGKVRAMKSGLLTGRPLQNSAESANTRCSNLSPNFVSNSGSDLKLDSVEGMHDYACFAQGYEFKMFFQSVSRKLCVSPQSCAHRACRHKLS